MENDSKQAEEFAAAARRCDRQVAAALLIPQPTIGKGFYWTRFHRWYWENLVVRRGVEWTAS